MVPDIGVGGNPVLPHPLAAGEEAALGVDGAPGEDVGHQHWNPTEDYISRGFLYPFLHSISDFVETPPEGYSRGKGGAMLEGYQDEDIPEERKVNVIAIMREAYADFSRFGIKGLPRDM